MDVLKHILFLLNVKFTSTFLRKLYMENPNNTNLLGFSNMLRFYGIDTQPGKITNKETFENEIIPFLTKLHDDFVVVEDCKDNKYKVFSDIYTYIEKDTFLKIWDGTFLAFEKTPQSCEPQYENHRKEEKSKKIFTILGYGSLLILCLLIVTTKENIVSTVMNILGCGIGYFLTYCILAQHTGKNIAKKICTSNHHFDCNIEYRFGGIIDLVDICVAYFASFFFMIVCSNLSPLFTAILWASAIPAVAWSLWAQFFRIKKICPLCLSLQISILVLNVFNICSLDFGKIFFLKSDFDNAIYYTLLFIIFLSFSTIYSKKTLGNTIQIVNVRRSDNFLKEQYLLLLNRFTQNINSTSQYLDSFNWGTQNAQKRVVAVFNPTCIPCALGFLNIYNAMALNNSIKLHIFFTYWTKEQHEKLEILFSAILQNPDKILYIIQKWYNFGIYSQTQFEERFCTKKIEIKSIDYLIGRQKEWCEMNNVHSTPTFFLNESLLPKGIDLMDIINF